MSRPKTPPGASPEQPLAGPRLPDTSEQPAPERDKSVERICAHGRLHRRCNECGGSSMCKHKRRRSECNDCGGCSMCEHKRMRRQCTFCRPASVVKKYKYSAKKRGYSWALTDLQAMHLFKQPCAYCGVVPSGGIDRRKNEYGYTVSNSLPCCKGCNFAKQADSAKAYIERCHSVSKHCVDRETFMKRNAELQKQLKEFEQWQSESTNAEPAELLEK